MILICLRHDYRKLMDSLILRSKTVHRKISDENQLAEQVKQLFPLLPEIDENKELPIKWPPKMTLRKW